MKISTCLDPFGTVSRMMRAIITTVVLVALGAGCAGTEDDVAGATEPSAEVVTTPTTEPELTTTTTTTPPTTEATTTTSSTTTTEATTTTIDPGAENDLEALFLLSGIQDGTAAEVIDSLIDIVEPFPLDRVDVLTATLEPPAIVIVGTSGYSTDEYQVEAAVDTFTRLVDLWDVPQFAGQGEIKIGLDLTIDGRQYVVPFDSIVSVMRRQATPESVLGV